MVLLLFCCVHAWYLLVVSVFLQRVAAEQALKTFQEHPEAWTRVDSILEKAKTQHTKFFALQVSFVAKSAPAACIPAAQHVSVSYCCP